MQCNAMQWTRIEMMRREEKLEKMMELSVFRSCSSLCSSLFVSALSFRLNLSSQSQSQSHSQSHSSSSSSRRPASSAFFCRRSTNLVLFLILSSLVFWSSHHSSSSPCSSSSSSSSLVPFLFVSAGCTCTCPTSAPCVGGCATCVSHASGTCDCWNGCGKGGSCSSGYSNVESCSITCCPLFDSNTHCSYSGCPPYNSATCATCKSGYYGSACAQCPPCQSGGGYCFDSINGNGTCGCYPGNVGPYCQYSRSKNCNNHGNPTSSGGCNCDTGYTGSTCGLCDTQNRYYGAVSSGCVYCHPNTTCSGHGTCDTSSTSTGGSCQCTPADVYAAPKCATCTGSRYNFPTCTYCDPTNTCNNRGSCLGSGACSCTAPNSGPNCDVCPSGTHGSTCTACPNGAANPCHSIQGYGKCNDGFYGNGLCQCSSGFTGSDCSQGAPTISTITVSNGPTSGGTQLIIYGSLFGSSGTVRMGNPWAVCSQLLYQDSSITCTTPSSNSGRTSVTVIKTLGSTMSNNYSFTYDPPTIGSFVVPDGPSNPAINNFIATVTGTNLGVSGNVIWDGALLPKSSVVFYGHQSVQFRYPTGSLGVNVVSLRPDITDGSIFITPSLTFTIDPPLVQSISASSFPTSGGNTILINGINFGNVTDLRNPITVTLSDYGYACQSALRVHDDTILSCTLPEGAGVSYVAVSVAGASGSLAFSYDPPTISSISGCDVTVGNAATNCDPSGSSFITIVGTNFGSSKFLTSPPATDSLVVTIAGTPCSSLRLRVNHTQLICGVPSGAGANVEVRVQRGTAIALNYGVSYRGPAITKGTLRLFGQPTPPTAGVSPVSLPAASTSGGDKIAFEGLYFIGDTIRVWYGALAPNGHDIVTDLRFPCIYDSVHSTSSLIVCTTAVGFGGNYHFKVETYVQSLNQLLVSNMGDDSYSYPVPVIFAGTLKLPTTGEQHDVDGTLSAGDLLQFRGANFGVNFSYVGVYYGVSGDLRRYTCDLLASASSDGVIACVTRRGEGTGYNFTVDVGLFRNSFPPLGLSSSSYTVTGMDTYSYPQLPIIDHVIGCPQQNPLQPSQTINCPTLGVDDDGNPVRITVVGKFFGFSGAVVRIRGKNCDGPIHVIGSENSMVTCTLPPNVGFNVPVELQQGTIFSRPYTLLSYAPPLITSIEGCATMNGNFTSNCNRYGGDLVTLHGKYFGDPPATVLIGGAPCYPLQHGNPVQEVVYCNLPIGVALSVPVTMIQNGGDLSVTGPVVSYTQCQPGYYGVGLECPPCPIGNYSADFGQLSCNPCPTGRYGTHNATIECTKCELGRHNSLTQQTTCVKCTRGNYTASLEAIQCLQCSAGRFSNQDESSSCANCPSGRFQNAIEQTDCIDCPIGRIAAKPGLSGCQSCLPGSFIGSAGQSLCQLCTPGYYQFHSGATSCLSCPLGRYNVNNGLADCVDCQRGRFTSLNASTDCTDCPIGYFQSEPGQSSCLPCPPGTISTKSGAVTCNKCDPGQFSSGWHSSTCLQCEAGNYQDQSGAIQCNPCPRGSAIATPGQPICTLCAPGTYTAISGSTSCQKCPAGRHSNMNATQGSVGCLDCDPGTYGPIEGLGRCINCTAGHASSAIGAKNECPLCTAGTFADLSGMSVCTGCPAGQMGQEGANGCSECEPGRYSSGGASICLECDAGKYQDQSSQPQCTDCPLGKSASSTGSTSCDKCTAGNFANTTGSKGCMACPPGSNSLQQALIGPTSCSLCNPGSITSQAGQAHCTACELGRFAANYGMSGCVDCFPGTYTNVTNTVHCSLCPPGTRQTQSGMILCDGCSPGTYQNISGKPDCTPCGPASFTGSPGQSICKPCPQGRYSDRTGLSDCLQCDAGKYQDLNGTTVCKLCPAGSFQRAVAMSGCDACPEGTFSSTDGQQECLLCEPGTFNNQTGQEDCATCPIGEAQSYPGETRCEPCLPGFFSPSPRQPACTPCAPGTVTNDTGATVCGKCAPGFVQANPGQIECEECGEGKYSVAGLPKCLDCDPGRYGIAVGATGCLPCEIGFSQQTPGTTSCEECQVGRYAANSTGQSSCDFCEAGTFMNGTGATVCDKCPAGFYQSQVGQTTCNPCEVGAFSSSPGAPSCPKCLEGGAAPLTGMTRCTACDTNSFSDTSRSECLCNVGFYRLQGWLANFSAFEGTQFCIPCPRGANCDNPGSTFENLLTDAGWWRPNTESLAFYQCKPQLCVGGYDELCASNREGPVCALCIPDTAASSSSSPCISCPSHSVAWAVSMILCILVACAIILMYYLILRVDAKLMEKTKKRDQSMIDSKRSQLSRGQSSSRATTPSQTNLNAHGDLARQSSAVSLNERPGSVFSNRGSAIVNGEDATPGAPPRTLSVRTRMNLISRPAARSRIQKMKDEERPSVYEPGASGGQQISVSRSRQSMAAEVNEEVNEEWEEQWDEAFEDFEDKNDPATRSTTIILTTESTVQPNFTYKLKIMVGFFQIVTGLAFALRVPWPTDFHNFVSVFTFFNLDFVPWQSLACATSLDYMDRILVVAITPVAVLAALILFFLGPLYYLDRRDMSDDDSLRAARKRSRRKFWKLVLFTIFLMYPNVSSQVLGFFVCNKVEGSWYLEADYRIYCYDAHWFKYIAPALIFIVIYPIGVPSFFLYMLKRYRHRLTEPGPRLQLGFLYEAYELRVWYFELIDMGNKLFMTSLLAFFPSESQMPVALVVTGIYLGVILLLAPYVRKTDDQLHIFVQVIIFLVVLIAFVLQSTNTTTLDRTSDIALSVLLISICILLMLFFLMLSIRTIRKMIWAYIRIRKEKQVTQQQRNSKSIPSSKGSPSVQPSSNPEFEKRERELTDNPVLGPSSTVSIPMISLPNANAGGLSGLLSAALSQGQLVAPQSNDQLERERGTTEGMERPEGAGHVKGLSSYGQFSTDDPHNQSFDPVNTNDSS